MSTSLRTIWISIRAMNYTINVFNDVIRQLTMVTTNMNACAIANMNMAKAALSAGILFSVLGSQIGGTGGQLLQYASYAMYAVAAIQAIQAALRIFTIENIIAGRAMAETWAPVIFPVLAFMGVFLALKDTLGTIPALILAAAAAMAVFVATLWAADIGMNILTVGAAAAIGLAGMAAVAGMMHSGGYQMGTRVVGATGPALLHKGEVVYNPSTGRPTQIGNDLAGGMGRTTMIDASMHVDTLNTKMDEEQLQNAIKKQSRTIAQNNR